MFSIGEFARLTRVSVRMLRHYDELGLLKPRHTDRFTGFRYYDADQLARLNRLIAFKDLGFSLEQIRLLLDVQLSAGQLTTLFGQKRTETERQLAGLQQRLAALDRRLAGPDQGNPLPASEVVVRPLPAQLVAVINLEPAAGEDEELPVAAAFDNLERFAARRRARLEAAPLTIYSLSGQPAGPAVQVAVPLSRPVPEVPPILVYELPGYDAALCLIHSGSYHRLGETLDRLLRRVEAGPHRVAGPLREVYLRFAADQQGYTLPAAYLSDAETDFVTELQLPVTLERT